jgi:Phosphopantetheine attachment site
MRMDRQVFIETLSEALGLGQADIDLSKSFVENGGYSLAAVRWIDRVGSVTPVVLSFLDVMNCETLLELFEGQAGGVVLAADADAEEGFL